MIKLEDVLTLANVNNLTTLIKGYVDDRISALATSVSDIMEDVSSSIDALETGKLDNDQLLSFSNISVEVSAWESDTTYTDYPYRATINCSGITASYCADVNFGLTEAVSGNFAPVNETEENIVYIYAKETPTETITIPTILARKVVS